MKIDEIKTIVKLMSDNDLTEFKIESEEMTLCLRRAARQQSAPAPVFVPAAVPAAAAPAAVSIPAAVPAVQEPAAPAPAAAVTAPQYADSLPIPSFWWIATKFANASAFSVSASPAPRSSA